MLLPTPVSSPSKCWIPIPGKWSVSIWTSSMQSLNGPASRSISPPWSSPASFLPCRPATRKSPLPGSPSPKSAPRSSTSPTPTTIPVCRSSCVPTTTVSKPSKILPACPLPRASAPPVTISSSKPWVMMPISCLTLATATCTWPCWVVTSMRLSTTHPTSLTSPRLAVKDAPRWLARSMKASSTASSFTRAANGSSQPTRHWPRCAKTAPTDRKSTRLNSSHVAISYAVFCLKKEKYNNNVKRLIPLELYMRGTYNSKKLENITISCCRGVNNSIFYLLLRQCSSVKPDVRTTQ